MVLAGSVCGPDIWRGCRRVQAVGDAEVSLKAQLGLPANGTIIFSDSRAAPEKDTTTLLAAVAELLKASREWLLCLTGRHGQFAKLAIEFGVSERVIVGDAVHPTKMLQLTTRLPICVCR